MSGFEVMTVGDFLTRSTAPWWAVVGTPVLTYFLGQYFATKSAREQGERDADDRANERKHNAAIEDSRQRHQLEEARATRSFDAQQARLLRVEQACSAALGAIGVVHAEIMDAGQPSGAEVQQFIAAVQQMLLYVNNPDVDAAARHAIDEVTRLFNLSSITAEDAERASGWLEPLRQEIVEAFAAATPDD